MIMAYTHKSQKNKDNGAISPFFLNPKPANYCSHLENINDLTCLILHLCTDRMGI